MDDGEAFAAFCHDHDIVIKIDSNLGSKIRGFCYYDGETYNVHLNNRFSTEQLQKTTIHEMIHVMKYHFDCDVIYADRCEVEVHEIIKEMRLSFI